MICENSFAFIAPKRGQRGEFWNREINQQAAFTSIVEFVQTCPGLLGPRMLDYCLVSLLLQPLTHPGGLSCDPAVVLFGDKCFIVRLRDFVTKMNSLNIMEGKCVKCSYSQNPIKRLTSGNGLWPLKRGWPLNRGRNNRIAIIGTFTAGRLTKRKRSLGSYWIIAVGAYPRFL